MKPSIRGKVAGLGLLLATALCGCTSDIVYRVKMIPRTPENLAAYRECQRTFAVATGYSDYGFADLKRKCLNTLQGIVSREATGKTSAYESIKPSSESCTLTEKIDFFWSLPLESEYFYFCDSPQK